MHTAGIIDDAGIVANRAAGYETSEDGRILNQAWVAPTSNSTGDGALYLTVLDFAKWQAAVRDRKVLKAGSWAEMLKPVVLNDGKTYPYGFGWFLDRFAGHPAQHHSGSWQGFITQYTRYLETNTAIVVLLNLREGSAGEVAKNVAALVNPRLAPPPGAPIADVDSRITARLRSILSERDIPATEHAAFEAPDTLERTRDAYRKRREPLGELQELALVRFRSEGQRSALSLPGSLRQRLCGCAVDVVSARYRAPDAATRVRLAGVGFLTGVERGPLNGRVGPPRIDRRSTASAPA
jgi:hypothetical protein